MLEKRPMSKNAHVFIVEDDEGIQQLLAYTLSKEGYRCTLCGEGGRALKAIEEAVPDVVLLDVMLPGVDGFTLCRELKSRASTKEIAVIMLTAKGDEADIVQGLEIGVDDYITKPFSPRVLLARIRAVLRRKTQRRDKGYPSPLTRGELTLDTERFEVRLRERAITMTATEFQLLHCLASQPGRVFTRQQIVDVVRGEDYAVTERAVDVQVVGVRKKLGPDQDLIQTVRGVGYRFKEQG